MNMFGMYRGRVVNNVDPLGIARVEVVVPGVSGGAPQWAMPSVPFTGPQSGFFAVPPNGANVWVEFERGKPDLPVWSGGFWTSRAEVPALAVLDPAGGAVVIESSQGTTLVLGNASAPGMGIVLKSPAGAMIQINDIGITITNGRGAVIQLVASTVMVNNVPL